MEIQKSGEDYLEAMLILEEEKGYIRSIDIAKRLSVSKPSVSYAVKRLRESDYIEMDTDGLITLTPKGYETASDIYGRHKALRSFLMMLGVEKPTAEADACKIEHDISRETFDAICRFVEKAND